MGSTFYELDCGEDEPVVMERTDDGEIIFHGFDLDAELAAQELGFDPSVCFRMFGATRAVEDEGLKLEPFALRAVLMEVSSAENQSSLDNALFRAAGIGRIGYVVALFGAGADLTADDDEALRRAARYGHADVVELLLRHGANAGVYDNEPLLLAANYGQPDVVKILIDAGADVHSDDDRPLRWSAGEGHKHVVKILIDAGADVSAENYQALAFAAIGGHAGVVQLLLAEGATATVVVDAIKSARKRGQYGVVDILMDWIEEHG